MASSRQKILIISCSGGLGHIRAAEALLENCRELNPEIEVKHIDIANYSGRFFRAFFVDSYNSIVKYCPQLFKYIYHFADNEKRKKIFNILLPILKKSCRKFFNFVNEFNPDRVICTHFAPPALLNTTKHTYPVDVVVTDYYAHQIWLVTGVRNLFVPHESIKKELARKYDGNVVVSGIPIHPRFFKKINDEAVEKKYNLDPHYPTILFVSGGKGTINTFNTIKQTLDSAKNLNIIAISGKNNPKLFNKLNKLKSNQNNFKVMRFTDSVDELMKIADVVITKPGGLTVSELLCLKKSMILTNPIPGQEEKNAEFIMKNNFGFKAQNTADVLEKINLILKHSTPLSSPDSSKNPSEIILQK
jgi:processive 1,2-diacylglycerol beta-glucosyltransferase